MSALNNSVKRAVYMDGMIVSALVFQFLLTLIRAATTGITFDESFTYQVYVHNINYFSIEEMKQLWDSMIANNHLLNSFLIYIADKLINVPYSEFVIRLPILVFYAVYLSCVYKAYKNKKIGLICLVFLTCCYYLNEFYGLARGYAMANTFVFLALMKYKDWKASEYAEDLSLIQFSIFLLLAAASQTIVLLLYPAFGILAAWHLIEKKKAQHFFKKYWWYFVLFMACSFGLAVYHMHISANGLPLYTSYGSFYTSVVKSFVRMFVQSAKAIDAVSVFLVVLLVSAAGMNFKQLRKYDFMIALIIFAATCIGTQIIFHKGYITERELIPFYSFFILSFAELFNNALISSNQGILKKYISVLLTGAALISFIAQINLKGTRDWSSDYPRRDEILAGYIRTGEPYTSDPEHPSNVDSFYNNKYQLIAEKE